VIPFSFEVSQRPDRNYVVWQWIPDPHYDQRRWPSWARTWLWYPVHVTPSLNEANNWLQ